MLVWNMKLSFGERQPYRIWFDYLKTCLNDESLSKKVDREYYKSWNLSEIKNSKFDKWFKVFSYRSFFSGTTVTTSSSEST